MRKLVVLTFVSLDGVMQAPGGPEEDRSGGFACGGWTFPYFDEFSGNVMGEQMGHPFDLLLGRKTYEIFASCWPQHKEEGPGINRATRYVASRKSIRFTWEKSVLLRGEIAEAVRKLKAQDGPELQVHGSSDLVQTLLRNDLVDELWLKIFPLTLGSGKRLFGDGARAFGFELTDCKVSPKGVIIANYKKAGSVKTGSFAS
jgi:dihydrofolate reductase